MVLAGNDISHSKAHDLIKLGVSYVPQGRQVFTGLSVKENLIMGAYLTKDSAVIKQRIEDVLRIFPDLRSRLNDDASALSGGQQQMLSMGRALMQRPKLLLLDEPSAGLSPKLVSLVFDCIKTINKEGCAVLMVEQNAKAACQIADRIYVLDEGKIALTGDKTLLKDKRLARVYLGGHEDD
jgi:branched-chain amino acid transport system ATP-binding protein